jgi:AcrR family transcriptional regulator
VSDSAPEGAASPAPLRRSGLRERVATEILAAAARVLATSGDGASMNDVAAAAGIARGTLYRYFPTRRALVERLRELALEDASSRLAAARVEQVAPLEGLERAVRAFVDMGELFVVAARERGRPGGAEFEGAITSPLRTLIERAQADAAIRDDMGPWWLAEALLGLIVAGTSAARLGKEDTIAAIRLLFLEGARAR